MANPESDPFAAYQKPAQNDDPFAAYQSPLVTAASPAPAKPGFWDAADRMVNQPLFPALARLSQQQGEYEQQDLYRSMGPESAKRGKAMKFLNYVQSLNHATARVLYGTLGMSPADIAALTAGFVGGQPEIPAAYFAAKGTAQAPGAISEAVKNPTPDNVAGALGSVATAVGGVAGVGEGIRRASGKLNPQEIRIGDTNVPVLSGEAHPETVAGRIQKELKRSGAGEGRFNEFAKVQQEAVKKVIRNVARKTSGMIGPTAEEPGAAMGHAADAAFAQATPMYEALDASLVTVPDAMENVSQLTEQAIARAEKLGVTVDRNEGGGVVPSTTYRGQPISEANHPPDWTPAQVAKYATPADKGQPISTYMKVRSQLLKMQRSSPDAATRNAIANEISTMNGNMETALKGTPLLDNWHEANRLWSKGYAIGEVSDAIHKATRGTPPALQAPGMSKVPTEIRGAVLVSKLNDLSRDGVLQKAFSREEALHLRQAADILDRASDRAGREFGFGYSAHSTLWRNIVKLPALPLVKAMTTLEGVNALRTAEAAKTPLALRLAIKHLSTVVAATGQSAKDKAKYAPAQ